MKRILSTLTLWLLYVPLAHAQDLGSGQLDAVAGQANIKGQTKLPELIGNLVRVAIGMLGIVFLVLTIYAGFLYLTARGEEEKVKHAKETLSRGVIGLIIITAAYAIATFVISALTGAMKTTGT
jgi:amino acid transporter